jgi:predicted transcriptional regulator
LHEPATVAPPKPRVSARERELRRQRIFAAVREGRTHEEIAASEGLTGERIRQIVTQTLDLRAVDETRDHMRLQIARLEPVLQLMTEKVKAGDLRAVDRLLKVLERLDKYQRAAAAMRDRVKDDHAFKKKLSDLVLLARAARQKAAAAAAAIDAPAPAGAGSADEKQNDDVSKFFRR